MTPDRTLYKEIVAKYFLQISDALRFVEGHVPLYEMYRTQLAAMWSRIDIMSPIERKNRVSQLVGLIRQDEAEALLLGPGPGLGADPSQSEAPSARVS